MFKHTLQVHIRPDRYDTTVEGTGTSPEQARRDAEAQASAYVTAVRRDRDPNAVLFALTTSRVDYDTTKPEPLKGLRNPNRSRRLPDMQNTGLRAAYRWVRSLLPW